MNANLVLRIVTAVVFIPVILIIFYLLPPLAMALALAVICGIAAHEALVSTGFLKNRRVIWYSVILSAMVPLWIYRDINPKYLLPGLYVYVVFLFAEAIHSRKEIKLEQMGGTFFLSLFIPYFLCTFLRLRRLDRWEFYVALPFVIAFLSDASAYFTGMAFGKHKLAPDLSPKKTVEGAVGGLVGATLGTMLTGLFFQTFFGEWEFHYPVLALFGFLGSVASQLGDLSFSYIKREYGIKDFGKILPGHGGILDRFDSVIFCAPLVELLLYILPAVK